MDLNKYFFMDRNPSKLFGIDRQVESGEHGISKDDKGFHYATSYHIYNDKNDSRVLARPELRSFLQRRFPNHNDLTNAFKAESGIEIKVKYIDQPFSIKKVRLEWVVQLFEQETVGVPNTFNKNDLGPITNTYRRNELSEIIEPLNQISENKFLHSPSNSNKKLFEDIIGLIANNPDKLELLSLTYMPVFFEKLCSVLAEMSEKFSDELKEYQTVSKNTNEGFQFSSYHYLCSIKFQKIKPIESSYKISSSRSIKNFRFDENKSLSKMFDDIFYLIDKRNDLVHAEFVSEDMTEWVNSSKKLIKLMLELKGQYLEK